MRILVPLDDAIQAQRVLAYVKVLAARGHGTLKLIRATDVEAGSSIRNRLNGSARGLSGTISLDIRYIRKQLVAAGRNRGNFELAACRIAQRHGR